jgi:hypothetical protein
LYQSQLPVARELIEKAEKLVAEGRIQAALDLLS